MKLVVSPTTGGHLDVCVSQQETVRGLRQVLARKYRIAPARINLLHKDRVLKDGTLQDNEVKDGSRIVLCPNMESGTSNSHAEHSVIQALRNLSDSQIHDFLTGKSPLTLAIRLGEHLMFVQLQLSTAPSRSSSLPVQPSSSTSSHQPPPSSTPSPAPSPLSVPAPAPQPLAGKAGSSSGAPAAATPGCAPALSPVSLLQASHNLTEKLKELTQLTQQTLQTGVPRPQTAPPAMPPTPPPSPPPSPGAVINSMQQVGKGIFSGTFSGTLDPRLQDGSGHPRRDVNTILHILHDLLVAQPGGHLSPRGRHGNNNNNNNNRAPPQSSSSSSSSSARPDTTTTTNNANAAPGGTENASMRDKVQQVQQMLDQRRQRRSARRQNQRPYPAPSSAHRLSVPVSSSSSAFLSSDPSNPISATAAATAAAAAATAESNVETSNYRKPNMEQETVAV